MLHLQNILIALSFWKTNKLRHFAINPVTIIVLDI